MACRLALSAMLWSAAAAADAADIRRGAEIAAGRCAICHGADGESASPLFPRLAGQHAEYLARQLADFAGGRRRSDAMERQARDLSPDDMRALGAYFASRQAPPPELEAPAEALAAGRGIFERGRSEAGVPACASCHGPRGHGTAELPRLAGQHPRYIEGQLRHFERRPVSASSAAMHAVATRLGDRDAHAVAEFVATLD